MFFIIPVGVDYRARRYPVVTFTLMAICTIVYLISMVHTWNNPEAEDWWFETFWLIPEKSTWYTYITSSFVHGGLLHLIGNMVYLFLFGSCVEDLIGRGRFLAFYFIGDLVSSFTHIALTPEHFASGVPTGGASGAISACMGGYVLLLLKSKIEFKWVILFFFRLFSGEFSLPAWLVLSFWFAEDVFGMWVNLKVGGAGGGVAFGAHIGGFVGGMLMIALLKPFLKREWALEEAAETEAEAPTPAPAAAVAVAVARRPLVLPSARPVVEEPMLLIFDAGAQTGPFTMSYVCQMVREGTLSHQAMYWQEGMPEWRSVQEIA